MSSLWCTGTGMVMGAPFKHRVPFSSLVCPWTPRISGSPSQQQIPRTVSMGYEGVKARLFPSCSSCFVISLLHSSCPCLEQDLGPASAEEGEPLVPCLGLPSPLFLPISSCFVIWRHPRALASGGMTGEGNRDLCRARPEQVSSDPAGPMDAGENLKGSGWALPSTSTFC